MQETLARLLVGKTPWRRDRLPTPVFLGFPGGSGIKQSTCNAGDLNPIPGLGRLLEKGKATHSSVLACPCIECIEFHDPILYSPWGRKESDATERLSLSCRKPKKTKRAKIYFSLSWIHSNTGGLTFMIRSYLLVKVWNSRETSTSASLTMLKPLTVWITTNCGKFLKRWEYQTAILVSWETMWVKKQQLEPDMEQLTVQNWEESATRLHVVTLLI